MSGVRGLMSVNFASADGQAYLGVNRLSSTGEFRSAVGAVPGDVYPIKQPRARPR